MINNISYNNTRYVNHYNMFNNYEIRENRIQYKHHIILLIITVMGILNLRIIIKNYKLNYSICLMNKKVVYL